MLQFLSGIKSMLILGRCRDISRTVHLCCHRGGCEGDLATVIPDPLQPTYEFIFLLPLQGREKTMERGGSKAVKELPRSAGLRAFEMELHNPKSQRLGVQLCLHVFPPVTLHG